MTVNPMRAMALCLCLLPLSLSPACKKSDPAPTGKRYAVTVDAKSSKIRVVPEGGWKMNLEYEHRFEGKVGAAPSVKVEKPRVSATEQAVVIPVPAKAGEACAGSVFFAICTEKKCVPVEEKVTWTAGG